MRYVTSKVVKRLESFRVRNSKANSTRTILLPLTFASADIVLLQILGSHLQRQRERTGRTGFELRLVFVDASNLTAKQKRIPASALEAVQSQFPNFPLTALDAAESVNDDDLAALSAQTNSADPSPASLQALLSALPSASSLADVLSILTSRIVARHARQHRCEALFAPHTTTALAALTLAEAAKGRGFQLAEKLADGGGVGGFGGGSADELPTYYPLRDLLGREVDAYANIALPAALRELVLVPREAPMTSESGVRKTTTIDELMAGYFNGVEEQYPGIVTNVVRTVGKLDVPERGEEDQRCRLCRAPVRDGGFGIHGWGGDQEDVRNMDGDGNTERRLCYGCARTVDG